MDYEIDPEQVKALRDCAAEFLLLDVREPWEVQTAYIEGSTFIPMDQIPARQQELDPDQHIVVMCHHGVRSMHVTSWLRQQGFEKVQSMRGGIHRWSRFVDPNLPTY